MKRYAALYLLTAFLLLCCSAAVSAEPFETIISNGAAVNRVDIAVVGDGYTAAEMQKYRNDVQNFIQLFFNQEPFREYQHFFNVHRIDVTSSQSGADHPERTPPVFVNTAFDATYNCSGIQRLICVNYSKVVTVVNNTLAATQSDIIILIVNDSQYGGSGGSISVASTHPEVAELVLHELGHSFGLLADEYGGPPPPSCNNSVEPSAANATKATDRSSIKWNVWIDASTPIPTFLTANGVPGLYQGAQYCDVGLYRPTFNSKMRNLGQPYDQINAEQLIKRIYNVISPLDSAQPAAADITIMRGQSQTFGVSVPTTLSSTIVARWYLNGQFQQSGMDFSIDSSGLTVGSYLVEVIAKDDTLMVRRDPENLLSDSHAWNLQVIAAPSPTPTPSPTPPFGLQTETNSNQAIALDSVTHLRDPLSLVTANNFSSDQRTRIVLFATGIPAEDYSLVTAQVEDGQQVFPLPIENIQSVPNFDWLTQIVVRLPDGLVGPNVGVIISVRGVTSNKSIVQLKQ